ncbi:MAG TPA: hypothetical protein VFQ12_06745 [Thermoleophilaceae bacterium]|nr:hypothetical protein [Thermoleophilaceae bacterium]
MRPRRSLALLAAIGVAGCGASDSPDEPGPAPRMSANERLVRDWSEALSRDDFEQAAGFFARGALIEQSRTFRLPDRRAALAFNRSLPCRGRVIRVEDRGDSAVASFTLSPRPGVPAAACNDVVRVRFRSRGGRFVEWRQLPPPAAPGGQRA